MPARILTAGGEFPSWFQPGVFQRDFLNAIALDIPGRGSNAHAIVPFSICPDSPGEDAQHPRGRPEGKPRPLFIRRRVIDMNREPLLREIIADICALPNEKIQPDLPLGQTKLHSSLGWALLNAKLRRRLGVRLEHMFPPPTYGDLCQLVFGENIPANTAIETSRTCDATSASSVSTKPFPPVYAGALPELEPIPPADFPSRCGIDIESVDSLPPCDDPWTDSFYRDTFSDAEIAYCLLRENPRMHFAARWSAKEALKKCLAEYSAVSPRRLELVLQPGEGVCFFHLEPEGKRTRIPAAISISHTETHAVAVAVATRYLSPPDFVTSSMTPPDDQDSPMLRHNQSPASRPSLLVYISLFLSLVSIVLVCYSILGSH